ncbi:hypothetical protein NDU88_008164 [Pleurodeles waltl]|uniref:Uncharacterized protein n=1 Tax=Pleurodeles waltl TaxID=8319 RepID=A0AAV7SUW5_PLEWA|nr:hypothetical protein NDU88_008164 [Pleurodeles waltl]
MVALLTLSPGSQDIALVSQASSTPLLLPGRNTLGASPVGPAEPLRILIPQPRDSPLLALGFPLPALPITAPPPAAQAHTPLRSQDAMHLLSRRGLPGCFRAPTGSRTAVAHSAFRALCRRAGCRRIMYGL